MHHFHIEIGGPDRTPQGVSLATSPDGTVSVAILGTTSSTAQAASLVSAHLSAERRIRAQPLGGVGYLLSDRQTGHTALVAAPVSLQQIYWSIRDGVLRVASRPEAILVSEPASRKPAAQSLYDYVYFHCLPGPSSIHEGLARLDSGTLLRWDGKSATIERYWRPTFTEHIDVSEADAAATLHRLLERAVRASTEGRGRFGAFLSGGLDSSTVAGYAARIQPGVPTISMGFDANGYDEMEYARIASRHFKTRPLEYYVTPDDVAATLPNIAAAFAEPFGNSSAAGVFHCARIAREQGLELLLAGDGGDEIFGGNVRYAKQMVFERYFGIPTTLRRSLLEPLVGAAARITTAFLIGKASSYIEQANIPLPDRLQTYNFLHRHAPEEVFTADALSQVDVGAPLRGLREEYAAPHAASPVDRMLFLDWKYTLHDNDLVKVNAMCDLAGIEVAYPMLDQSLVDFSVRLPPDWKVRGGELRWFYRRAMTNFLPQEILQKSKHGFGVPFGTWTRSHAGLQRLARESLGALGTRGYFQRDFLERALRMHAEGHASYYGELVWILMVLELWLQRHMPNAKL